MSVIKTISGVSGRDPNATSWMGDWVTATTYRKNAQVKHNSDLFTCSVAHTSAAGTEPGVGASWATKWTKQVDALSTSELLVISSHIADATKHREINDSATTSTTQIWSANKANTAITSGMTGIFSFENPVIDKDLATPPSPVEGARYIVAGSATDAWAGHETDITQYTTDAWVFTPATAGMACHVTNEALLYLFNGTIWQPVDSYVVATSPPGSVDYDTETVGVSTKLALEDHSHTLNYHDHSSSEISLAYLGQAAHTLEDFIHQQSAGRISGGVITDDGAGGVDISDMDGWFRTSDTPLDHMMFVTITGGNISAENFTDNALNYICAGYESGAPCFYTTTDRAGISENTQVIIGRIYKDGNDITIFNGGMNLPNYSRINHDRLVRRGFERMSGADIYETGTRCIGLTAGVFYFGMNKIVIAAKDTSDSDTYTAHRRDGLGGWTKVLNKTDINNTQYDDGTGLPAAVLPDGSYAIKWIYVDLLGELHAVDGQGYYTLSEAKVVEVPATLPTYITTFCKLAGKIIVLKGASSFTMVVSGYESALFGTTAPSNHEGMAGLQGGTTAEHYHLTDAQHTALTTNIEETVQDIAGEMFDGGTETGLSLTYSDETGKISGSVTYGTTSDTACEGDDVRLSDARTPQSHTHVSTELTDYVAPTAWVPTLTWGTAAVPPNMTTVARYTKHGKVVTFWLQITGADGEVGILSSISLPVVPANVGMIIPCCSQELVYTTHSDPRAYIVANDSDEANRLLKFFSFTTLTNSRVFSIKVTGSYEVA